MLATLAALVLAPNPFMDAWGNVESEIRTHYFQRDTRAAEMNERLARFAPLAKQAKSKQEFAAVVRSMIAEFGDSHFYFFTQDDQLFAGLDGARNASWDGVPADRLKTNGIDAWFWPTPAGQEVWMVSHGGAAAKAGLRRKDIVETCEGKPFEPVRSLAGKAGKKVKLGIRRGTQRLEIDVPVHQTGFWEELRGATTSLKLSGSGEGMLYLFPSQLYDSEGVFDYYLRRLTPYSAIILDLRDGLGGYFEPHVGPFLAPRSVVEWTLPGGGGRTEVALRLPLVVLTNRRTVSAREFMAYYLRKHAGAVIVGEPTSGGVAGSYVTPTYEWWNMMIPYSLYSIDGIVFERNPLAPDVFVPDAMAESGRDAIFERGIKEARRLMKMGAVGAIKDRPYNLGQQKTAQGRSLRGMFETD